MNKHFLVLFFLLITTTLSFAQTPDEEAFMVENDYFPHVQIHEQVPTHKCMAILIPFTFKDTGYTYLTGRFTYKYAQETKILWSFMTMILIAFQLWPLKLVMQVISPTLLPLFTPLSTKME